MQAKPCATIVGVSTLLTQLALKPEYFGWLKPMPQVLMPWLLASPCLCRTVPCCTRNRISISCAIIVLRNGEIFYMNYHEINSERYELSSMVGWLISTVCGCANTWATLLPADMITYARYDFYKYLYLEIINNHWKTRHIWGIFLPVWPWNLMDEPEKW